MAGYIWSFPRPDHISYGLITRPDPGWTSRAKSLLGNFIEADLGAEVVEQAKFYSAPVPCLGPGSWASNTVGGPGWALLGDAAGLVDPITGEGIRYALRSAELLADTFPDTGKYAEILQSDCVGELARASRMYSRFYRGRFMAGNFRKRMVQFAGRSPTLRTILGDLIAGEQSYAGLKKKLVLSAPRVAFDVLRNTVTGFRLNPPIRILGTIRIFNTKPGLVRGAAEVRFAASSPPRSFRGCTAAGTPSQFSPRIPEVPVELTVGVSGLARVAHGESGIPVSHIQDLPPRCVRRADRASRRAFLFAGDVDPRPRVGFDHVGQRMP